MTTIAIDDTHIVADGLRTTGNLVTGTSCRKLAIVEGKVSTFQTTVFGICGVAAMFNVLVNWYIDGADPEKVPRSLVDHNQTDWRLIVLDAKGLRIYDQENPWPTYFSPPMAFGSGGAYALGAMWAGASAQNAVELCSRNLTCTGGAIEAINYRELFAKAQAPARRARGTSRRSAPRQPAQ